MGGQWFFPGTPLSSTNKTDHHDIAGINVGLSSDTYPNDNSGQVTRVTRWVPLVEQELFTLLEHKSSLTVFSGVRVARSLVYV